jgi:hypothetical protein
MLEASGAGSRTMRLQRLVAQAVEAVSPARPVFLSTEMMTPEFFAGPVPKRWRVVPLGIVNRLALRSDSVSPEAVLETNRAVWLTYELASTLRTYYSPELQNVQLFYAASRSNLGMFCLEQGWREAALQNLEAALKLPAPGGFAEVVRQNIVRAQSRPN